MSTLQLDYARRPNRRVARLAAAGVVVALLLAIALPRALELYTRKRREYREYRAAVAAQNEYLRIQQLGLDYRCPAGWIAYEEDEARGQQLRAEHPDYICAQRHPSLKYWPIPGYLAPTIFVPPILPALKMTGSDFPKLYVGQRQRPDGTARLVSATAITIPGPNGQRQVKITAVADSLATSSLYSWRHNAESSEEPSCLTLTASDHLRLYFGQPDAQDPSRFVIGYELNGEPRVIRFHLTNTEIQASMEHEQAQ